MTGHIRSMLLVGSALSLRLTVVAIPRSLGGQEQAIAPEGPSRLTLVADASLRVEGTSTLRDFSCEAGRFDLSVDMDSSSGMPLGDLVRSASADALEVSSTELDCRNGKMNRHMREALQVGEYPTIRFRLERSEVVTEAPDSVAVNLVGILSLAGVERAITVPAAVTTDSSASVRVAGEVRFDMTDFDVEPPSLLFGAIRVGDEVTVVFDLRLLHEDLP